MKGLIFALSKIAFGTAMGYALSHHFSHPAGRGRKHVPLFRVGNVQITPNLLIATKNKRWHIHHWAYLPILYVPLIATIRPMLKRSWLHGLFAGAVIHGLTFGDRFQFSTR